MLNDHVTAEWKTFLHHQTQYSRVLQQHDKQTHSLSDSHTSNPAVKSYNEQSRENENIILS